MHAGPAAAKGDYHVTIALFDAKTGARITGADVHARVAELGLAGEEKQLEPMQIAGTETYGNFFPMDTRGHAPFIITVTIRLPGQAEEIKAQFERRYQ
jgi:hypothetical protein